MNLFWLILMFLPLRPGTPADNPYLEKIKTYLNAATVADKSRYMSGSYRSYFARKEGAGEGRDSALQSFQRWDGPLHPDVKILAVSDTQKTWKLKINERNDFTKLIGFPGWKATEIVTFDDSGLIAEAMYIPEPDQPNYKDWLKPAVGWLQTAAPDSLKEVYENGKLIKTGATARKWVRLLTRWRHSLKREPAH
jgi:hypothetical protein